MSDAPEELPDDGEPSGDAIVEEVPDPILDRFVSTAQAHWGEPELAAMANGQYSAVAIGLSEALAAIDTGELSATPAERGFLVGALAALRAVLMSEQRTAAGF